MLSSSFLAASRGASRAALAQGLRVMARENAGELELEGRTSLSCGKSGAEREAMLGESSENGSLPPVAACGGVASEKDQSWPVPLSRLPPPHANAVEQGRATRARAFFARLLQEQEATAQPASGAVESLPFPPEAEAASRGPFPLLSVLYEDSDMIAVRKPSGLYCEDVTELLIRQLQRRAADAGEEGVALTLMHRLDRDTSGVMLLSKSPAATKSLSKAFSGHSAQKTYVALGFTSGPPPDWTCQTLRTGHGRSRHGLWRVYAEEDIGRELPGGNRVKGMETRVEVLAVKPVWRVLPSETASRLGPLMEASEMKFGLGSRGHLNDEESTTGGPKPSNMEDCSHLILMRASPVTGRTHQIRLHCSFLRVPLVGDVKYGGIEDVADLAYMGKDSLVSCTELGLMHGSVALHATSLKISHPRFRQDIGIISPLPPWASSFDYSRYPYPWHGTLCCCMTKLG